MKLIIRDTDYAIRALCCIAKRKEEKFTAEELVKCLKMPRPFLRKILQRLNRKGFLKSYRGRGGGFVLAIKPEKILIGELIKAVQGPIKLHEHVFMKRRCPNIKKCVFKKKIDSIERYMLTELNSITLATLLVTESR